MTKTLLQHLQWFIVQLESIHDKYLYIFYLKKSNNDSGCRLSDLKLFEIIIDTF